MRLLLVLLIAACAASPPVRRFAAMDTAAVTKVIEDQAAAWNRGDLAGYMDGYAKTDALVFTSGGKVRTGWSEAFAHYQKRYATDPKAMGQLVFGITRVDAVGADAAVVLGTWKLTGSEHPGEGVFTLVFERRAEGWRIVHDHTSSLAPQFHALAIALKGLGPIPATAASIAQTVNAIAYDGCQRPPHLALRSRVAPAS